MINRSDPTSFFFFFFTDTPTTKIYTLPLHDPLPILGDGVPDQEQEGHQGASAPVPVPASGSRTVKVDPRPSWLSTLTVPPWFAATCFTIDRPSPRSEEHTSELQSQSNLVCRLLLEKK